MKKKYTCIVFAFLFSLLLSVFSVDFANAQENQNFKLFCINGMVLTEEYSLSEDCAIEIDNNLRFAVCPNSYAALRNECGIVNISDATWINVGDNIYVEEGIIAVDALSGKIIVETETQMAFVCAGSRLTVRVDDYGNAFNYCTEGSVELYSKRNDESMTLVGGEYIAVTVKRGFRILKETNDDEVANLGVKFIEDNELESNFGSECEIKGISGNFAQDGDIATVGSNRAYLLTGSDNTQVKSHTVYLECNNDEAVICVYDKDLNFVASSTNEKRANKPNVTILPEDTESNEFIVCVYSERNTDYLLKQIKYESVVDKGFNMLKSFVLPVCVALVLFGIYGIAESKKKKKPKF